MATHKPAREAAPQGALRAVTAAKPKNGKGGKPKNGKPAPTGKKEPDNNDDWEDRIRASVGSLRELIIIFTGITITASFTLFVGRHVMPAGANDHDSVILMADSALPSETLLLFLLILCVMRFYYGNVMILDRYYLLKGALGKDERAFGLDSFFIVTMTFGLAILGLVVQFPPIFFITYTVITLVSVIWLALNYKNINRERRGKAPKKVWTQEADTQFNWLAVNTVFLLISVAIVVAVIIEFANNAVSISKLPHDRNGPVRVAMGSWPFWLFFTTVLTNSLLDFIINHKEYFPRYEKS